MKVKVLKTLPQFKDVFVEGDILKMESKLEKEDRFQEVEYKNSEGKWLKRMVKVANKGNFIDYVVTTKDGNSYSGKTITDAIGYSTKINEIFEKL
jgi:hypothetical protein